MAVALVGPAHGRGDPRRRPPRSAWRSRPRGCPAPSDPRERRRARDRRHRWRDEPAGREQAAAAEAAPIDQLDVPNCDALPGVGLPPCAPPACDNIPLDIAAARLHAPAPPPTCESLPELPGLPFCQFPDSDCKPPAHRDRRRPRRRTASAPRRSPATSSPSCSASATPARTSRCASRGTRSRRASRSRSRRRPCAGRARADRRPRPPAAGAQAAGLEPTRSPAERRLLRELRRRAGAGSGPGLLAASRATGPAWTATTTASAARTAAPARLP